MPRYEVTAPDGRKFEVNAPDGATQDDVISYAKGQWDRRAERQKAGEADMRRMADPMSGMGYVQQFNTGMGKAYMDLLRGAAQMVNMGPSAAETRETRQLDAPLMNTGAGMAGNIAGNITAFAPLAVIPGANTVAGAGVIGALTGALQPTENVGERLTNMGVGGALSAGTQYAATTGAQKVGEASASRETRLAQQAAPTTREQTFAAAQKEGFVAPPSAMTDSFVGKRLESVAGKAALGQEAAIRNQSQFTDRLARIEAGIAPDEQISLKSLEAARNRMAEPYREISAISPIAKQSLADLREARQNANEYFKAYERLPLPSLRAKAERFQNSALLSEQRIEHEAITSGKPDLVSRLREARVALAKNYDVERALNLGSGEIDASVIGRMLDKGAPLTGNLELIGKTQQAFRPYMREGGLIPTPGVSKSEALSSALLGTIGSAASGSPTGLLAGGLPLLSGPTRSLLLSSPVQNAMIPQGQGAGLLTREAAMLTDPVSRERLSFLMRSLIPPAALSAAEAR